MARSVEASTVVYTLTGTMSGALGTSPFSNTAFTWTVNADTGGITQPTPPPQFQNIGTSSSINITGVANANFTKSIAVLVDQRTNHGAISVGGAALADETIGITDPTNVDAWSPALASNFGPLTGAGVLTGTNSLPTNQGNLTVASLGNLTFQAVLSSGASISAIQDAGSYTANVAEGGIFVVKGTGLSASGYNQATAPYPTSLGGTSITFTPVAGGAAATQALMIYTFNQNGTNQLAAVVPSTLAVGDYNVAVSYNGTSTATFPTKVVNIKPELLTQDSTGNGLALLQNYVSASQYDINRLTTGYVGVATTSPAKPGQTVIAWGTGLGPVPFPDNNPPPSGYAYSNVTVLVGGVPITPAYAGISGYAGLDQINFTLPANVPTGCAVSLQIVAGPVTSVPTTISIAPDATATACSYPGVTTQQLQQLDQGGSLTSGGFDIVQFKQSLPGSTVTTAKIGGGFTQVTGFELGALSSSTAYLSNSIGTCTVVPVSSTPLSLPSAAGAVKYLDAGQVTLNGPIGSNITNVALTETGNAYSSLLGETGISGLPVTPNGTIIAGNYTLAGAGGSDVGSFNTSLNVGPLLTITGGLPTTVTESKGLTLNWTGGNPADIVEIIGLSGTTTGTGLNAVTASTEFICTTTVGTGTFTVPASVLSQLPKISASAVQAGTGQGILEVSSGQVPVTFAPSLTAGGSVSATFSAFIGTGTVVTYQ